MNSTRRRTLGLIGAGTAAGLDAWAWICFQIRRRKSPQELERLRRLEVNRRGRITTSQILELIESKAPGSSARLIVYTYEVAGVTYEVAQDISTLPGVASGMRIVAGLAARVKHDLRRDLRRAKNSPT